MHKVALHKVTLCPVALFRILLGKSRKDSSPVVPQPGSGSDNLLLEDGGNLLLENGGVILLES